MNRCASCGMELPPARILCIHHDVCDVGWSQTNRIMCDFLHRHIAPPRLQLAERDEVLHECLQEMAA